MKKLALVLIMCLLCAFSAACGNSGSESEEADSNETSAIAENKTDIMTVTDCKFAEWSDGFDCVYYTIRNNSDKTLNTITANIVFLDNDKNIIHSTYPQTPNRLLPGQTVTLEAPYAHSIQPKYTYVDGFSFYDDTDNYDEIFSSDPIIYELSELAGAESAENTQENSELSFPEYSINGISFQLPSNWTLDSETDTMLVFSCASNEGDKLVVRSEAIPDIMKVEAGGENSILSKNDVPKHYGAPEATEIFDEYWTETNGIEYYEQYFSMVGKLNNGEDDYRIGRCIVIPINQTDSYFSALMLCAPDDTILPDADIILETITGIEQGEASYAPIESASKTYDAYFAAVNLTKADLRKSGDSYYYRGLPLLSKDCEWIDNPINKNGTVNQTAMYMKMGACLSGFGLGREGGNKWKDYAEILIGFVPDSRQEMIPYVENAIEFIITSESAYDIAKAVMHKFESLSCTSGSYDYAANAYDVEIPNLTVCAEEMEISEEMLGYIIAAFDAMGAEITFESNACSISLAMRTFS